MCTGFETLPCKSHLPPSDRSNMESSQLSCGEEKNAADFSILIGNARLSWTHAQCLLGRYGLMFRLRPTAIVTWRIATFEYLPVTNGHYD